jgi:hypothetical protein
MAPVVAELRSRLAARPQRGSRTHGLRWGAGGGDVPWRAVLHSARKHRATGHDQAGTNTLLGLEPERIRDIAGLLATRGPASPKSPPLWDGRAAERVVDVIERIGRGKPATSR